MNAERPLGWVHVAAVVIGAIVGVGIFVTPATLARALPSPTWILGIWVLGGVASVAGALVFAELGGRYPRAGGFYVFLREGFGPRAGPLVAFLYGWLQLLVVQPGSMAVIAIVLVDNASQLVGPLPAAARPLAAAGVIALFAGANLLGLRAGGRIQVAMAAMKLGALALLIGAAVAFGHLARAATLPSSPRQGGPASWLLLGFIPVLFTFGGAYHGTFIAGSVRDPERAVPRGIVTGIITVLVGYVGVNVAYLALLGQDQLAASTSPAADALRVAIGPGAGRALAVVIVLSAAGILNTVCLGFPFVIYAMARDGVFFARAGELDPETGRPRVAVALQALFACVAVVVGAARVDVLLVGIAFADAAFQAAVAVVQIALRRTPVAPGGMRAPWAAAWLFLLIEAGVAVGCLVHEPRESAFGAVVLAVGLLAYRFWRAR